MVVRKKMRARAGGADDAAEIGGTLQHRIPVIDKMMKLLELIEQSDDDVGINALTETSRVPRSTVYRILNTLASHGVVARTSRGNYRLSFRLVSLAAHVQTSVTTETLVAMAHPFLEALAAETGETCKLSVLAGAAAEVVDVVLSPNAMAPSSRVGSRFALHAGAASKALLAFAPAPLQAEVLAIKREAYTKLTIVDEAALRAELAHIRDGGVSFDRGEWNASVHAVAAPVLGVGGALVGALSVTYFADPTRSDAQARIIPPLLAASDGLSAMLGHRPPDRTERKPEKKSPRRAPGSAG